MAMVPARLAPITDAEFGRVIPGFRLPISLLERFRRHAVRSVGGDPDELTHRIDSKKAEFIDAFNRMPGTRNGSSVTDILQSIMAGETDELPE